MKHIFVQIVLILLGLSRPLLAVDNECMKTMADGAQVQGRGKKNYAPILKTALVQGTSGWRNLTEAQQILINEHLLLVIGNRLILTAPGVYRDLQVGPDFLSFASGEHQRYVVRWEKNRQGEGFSHHTLLLPEDEGYLDFLTSKTIKKSLTGNNLHPYLPNELARKERVSLGEDPIVLRKVQKEANKVAEYYSRNQKKKFVFVGPPGVGKKETMLALLEERIKSSSGQNKKLHIVTVDSEALANQHHNDIEVLRQSMSRNGADFEIIKWGGGSKSESIRSLVKRVKAATKPVVLISVMSSFRKRFARRDASKKESLEDALQRNGVLMRDVLFTWAYDETHHVGARLARLMFRELIDANDDEVFVLGTTATPTHRSFAGNIQKLFGYNAFWAYLDKPEEFLRSEHSHPVNRSVSEIVRQLFLMIDEGESTPFDRLYFLDPQKITSSSGGLFKKSEKTSGRYILDSTYYPELIDWLRPLLKERKRGFITVGTIEEANDLFRSLSLEIPELSFDTLHSRIKGRDANGNLRPATPEETRQVEEEFIRGDIDFLITVQKLDEGMNFPFMELYVDLNRTFTARQFIQRLGRVLRLAPDKFSVDVVTLFDVDEESVAEMLELLEAVLNEIEERQNKNVQPSLNRSNISPKGKGAFSAIQQKTRLDQLRALLAAKKDFWNANRKGSFGNTIARMQHIAEFADVVRRLRAAEINAEEDFYSWAIKDIRPMVFKRLKGKYEDFVEDVSNEAYLYTRERAITSSVSEKQIIYSLSQYVDLVVERFLKSENRQRVANSSLGEEDDAVLSSEDDIPSQVAHNFLLGELNSAIGKLHNQQKEIIKRRFGLDGHGESTLEEISSEQKLSRERIRQIEAKSIRSLQRSRSRGYLGEYSGGMDLDQRHEPDLKWVMSDFSSLEAVGQVYDGVVKHFDMESEWIALDGNIHRGRGAIGAYLKDKDDRIGTFLNERQAPELYHQARRGLRDHHGEAALPDMPERDIRVRAAYEKLDDGKTRRDLYAEVWFFDEATHKVSRVEDVKISSEVFVATDDLVSDFYKNLDRFDDAVENAFEDDAVLFEYLRTIDSWSVNVKAKETGSKKSDRVSGEKVLKRIFTDDKLISYSFMDKGAAIIPSYRPDLLETIVFRFVEEVSDGQTTHSLYTDRWVRTSIHHRFKRVFIQKNMKSAVPLEDRIRIFYEQDSRNEHSKLFDALLEISNDRTTFGISDEFVSIQQFSRSFGRLGSEIDYVYSVTCDDPNKCVVRRRTILANLTPMVFQDTWILDPLTGELVSVNTVRLRE